MTEQDFTFEEQVNGLIEQISAYIEHYHGGSVELDRIEGRTVFVRLGGARRLSPVSSHAAGLGGGHIAPVFPRHRGRRNDKLLSAH